MKYLSKVLSFSLIIVLLFPSSIFSYSETVEKVCFTVTAYYSPLPSQNFYNKSNYEAEIRLNGRGVAGASSKPVFVGMLAAPKSYPFGTKIYLEGIGVGDVQDRGGAIVPAGERGYSCDRIDIWMGYGDAGLKRAMNWGKRTVSGAVISDFEEVSIELSNDKNLEYYGLRVNPNSESDKISLLQELLSETGNYNGPIDGIYDSVKGSLVDYQVKSGVIPYPEHEEAGYFGPKTLTKIVGNVGTSEHLIMGKYMTFLDDYNLITSYVKEISENSNSSSETNNSSVFTGNSPNNLNAISFEIVSELTNGEKEGLKIAVGKLNEYIEKNISGDKTKVINGLKTKLIQIGDTKTGKEKLKIEFIVSEM